MNPGVETFVVSKHEFARIGLPPFSLEGWPYCVPIKLIGPEGSSVQTSGSSLMCSYSEGVETTLIVPYVFLFSQG